MKISVIIPAYNAEATIEETLDSVIAQSHRNWEAVVVDDGSQDRTVRVVEKRMQDEPRIRLIRQEHAGVSAARNLGVNKAHGKFLLFLDADDLILCDHLRLLLEALDGAPNTGAAYSGWARLAPGGMVIEGPHRPEPDDFFRALAHHSLFPIHCCLVRRELVLAVGGWDASYVTCEDWDLWLRIARMGTRFVSSPQATALYRMSTNSASLDAWQMWRDGLRVLALASGPDPRVPEADVHYAQGLPETALRSQRYYFTIWCAGLLLGKGEEGEILLEQLRSVRRSKLDATVVAEALLEAIPLATATNPQRWAALWEEYRGAISRFLHTLEEIMGAKGLQAEVSGLMVHHILTEFNRERPAFIDNMAAFAFDIGRESDLGDIDLAPTIERVLCDAYLEGTFVGSMLLPAVDEMLSAYVLRDAIASEFGWTILEQFLCSTLCELLEVKRNEAGLSVWRGEICLAEGLSHNDWKAQLFAQSGWLLFLQELWGAPERPLQGFYDPHWQADLNAASVAVEQSLTLEVSRPLPSITSHAEIIQIDVTVGGVAIGRVDVTLEKPELSPQELLAKLTKATGFELCRAAVREALLGSPLVDNGNLRARLLEAAKKRQMETEKGSPDFFADRAHTSATVLGHHFPQAIDTPLARRAAFPTGAMPELEMAARIFDQPIANVDAKVGARYVFYAPEYIGSQTAAEPVGHAEVERNLEEQASLYGRTYFETVFARRSDPWAYGQSTYETIKYKQTLERLPDAPIRRALEIGCAEGHFTAMLAPHVGTLLAADISELALERAAKRCSGLQNIEFVQLDIVRDSLPESFDLIVCSEVLYYVGRPQLKKVAEKLADALTPGGYLLTAHAFLVSDDEHRTGFDWGLPFGAQTIGEAFSGTRQLQLVEELRTPLYQIQLFQRTGRLRRLVGRRGVKVIEYSEMAALPEGETAKQIRWHGARPAVDAEAHVETARLPILMYHRIATEAPAGLAPYTVTPEAFKRQLQYLRDAGYYSITLEQWRAAMAEHRALPGRAIILTFDDGYEDFDKQAWPILQRYGFLATLFLVTGEMGGVSRWHSCAEDHLPLMTWEDVRRLHRQGLQIGAHSAHHLRLTSLSPTEVMQEAVRSRVALKQELGEDVFVFAYPYGSVNGMVRHLIGASGFSFGLTCEPRRSTLWDPLLALPRIEVSGDDSFADFVLKLEDGAG